MSKYKVPDAIFGGDSPCSCCGMESIVERKNRVRLPAGKGINLVVGAPAPEEDDGFVKVSVIDTPVGFISVAIRYKE